VILENHGVVVGGDDLQNAFQRFETLEFTAKTIIKAGHLGKVRYLSDSQINVPRRAAVPLPTFPSGPATSREKELRRELCEFVRRGYQQRLLISTEGSFSSRVDANSFLITPYQVDRFSIDADDLVLIRAGASESSKLPSRAARVHQAIYQRHPEFHAIANAYPVNATAFSVTGANLDTRTIPESYIFLRDVQRIGYGLQFQDGQEVAQLVSPQQPIAILENDGVLVCGTSALDAFDRLEVLESTAEAVINSSTLGPVRPMDDNVIAELNKAFFGK
jgi:L-fuculose-phosphate aldolase